MVVKLSSIVAVRLTSHEHRSTHSSVLKIGTVAANKVNTSHVLDQNLLLHDY